MRSVILLVLAAGVAAADEGGIAAESGDTLFAEGTALSLTYFRYAKTKLFSGTRRVQKPAEDEESNAFLASVTYALDADTSVGVVSGYVSNSEDAGAGDATLFAKRRLYYDSTDTWAFTCAVAAALQLPTGEAREEGVEPELQPGSGSWDPFVAVAATYEWDRFFVNAYTNLQLNTEGANDFKHGDMATVGASLGWRPWMEQYPGPMLVVEAGAYWQHEFAARLDGDRLADSGSDHLFGALRAKFSPRSGWSVSGGFDFPLYRSYRGEQLATDYRLTLGVACVF